MTTAPTLSAVGLLLASLMSLTNVFMEVGRKKAVLGRAVVSATFWCQAFEAVLLAIVLGIRVFKGVPLTLSMQAPLFGVAGWQTTPLKAYLIYLALDVALLSVANLLFFAALKTCDLSTAVPLLSFTSVLLIPTGFIILHELPPAFKLIGVGLIVLGCMVMYRRHFTTGWTEPWAVIFRDRGSRYMMGVAFLVALSSPLDKRLVLMGDIYLQGFAYSLGMTVFFASLAIIRREPFLPSLRGNLKWVAVAGGFDGAALLLQYASYHYIDVVIAISIKRVGMILSVFLGALFFGERDIANKSIAATVMFVGVLILYLPLNGMQTIALAAGTIMLMSFSLFLLGRREASRNA